jgi:glycosyltransferase involved in cell wall biosynthesis
MRIALVLPHTQEEFGISSDEEYAQHDGYEHKYAKLLMKMGHKPVVYYLSHKRDTSEFVHRFGHEVIRVPITLSFGVGKQFSLPLLERISEDYKRGNIEVCHIFSYYALQYDSFAILCKVQGMPFVAQMHGGGGMLNYVLRYPFLFFTLRMADKILYVRPEEEINVRRLLTKGEFIPNWVDRSVYKNLNLKRRNALLFVGNVSNARRREHKGIDILLDVFERLRNEFGSLELTIIGRHEKEWAHEFAGKGIKILGYVSSDELVKAYNTHSLCVFPSRVEAFPLVALESIACGTPAVITDVFGSAPFLKKMGYELIAQRGDTESFFNVLYSALKDANKRKRNARIGSKVIDKYFDERMIGKRLIDIYKSILNL